MWWGIAETVLLTANRVIQVYFAVQIGKAAVKITRILLEDPT